jgi:signal transduction histidine kinase
MQIAMDRVHTPLLTQQRTGPKTGRIPPDAATALALVFVMVIGWADYITGDYSMTVFYLIPVAVATWYGGRGSGWFIGLLSAAAWLAGDLALNYPSNHHFLMPSWNATVLALIYGVVVELLSSLHRFQLELERRVEQRTASLLEAHAELEAARMHFIEADKLESIGRLAAGVAHEVKNPLMTITMVADYLAEVVPPREVEGQAMIDSLREAVERANRVICEMLEFARPAALTLQPDNFHLVAERALGLVKHEMSRKRLNFVRDWCKPAPQLMLDRNKMEQVLVNVLLNAIQATPEGGRLTLRTRVRVAGFLRRIRPGFSSPSSPPNRSGRGRGSAFPSPGRSFNSTAVGSPWPTGRRVARASRFRFQ